MELTGICPVDDTWVMLRSSAMSMFRKVIVVFQGVLLRNHTVFVDVARRLSAGVLDSDI